MKRQNVEISGGGRRVRQGGVLRETRHGEDLEATPFLGLLVKRGSLGWLGQERAEAQCLPSGSSLQGLL